MNLSSQDFTGRYTKLPRRTVPPREPRNHSRSAREIVFVEFWSVKLARVLDPDFPLLRDALADGTWTAVWQPVAAYLPLAALALGFLPPLLTKTISNVYADSLLFVVVVVAGAILSGTVGVMLLAGYLVGSLVITVVRIDPWSFSEVITQIARLFVSGLVLAIPTLLIPRVAHGFIPPIPDRVTSRPAVKHALRVGLYATSCALLVFAWCQGLSTMMRPLVGLIKGRPDAQTVSPVTWHWPVVVFAAAAAAVARMILEEQSLRSLRAGLVADLKRKRWLGHRRSGLFRRVPKFVRNAASISIMLLVLGGTCSSWADGIVTALLVACVFLARMQLVGRLPARWTKTVSKIPVLVRFTAVLLAGYLLSAAVMAALWSSTSMRSVTLSTLLSLTLFILLFPEGAQVAASSETEPMTSAASASLGCALIAFLFGSVVAAHAQATENMGFYRGSRGPGFPRHARFDSPACSSLQDCYADASSAALTSSGTAAVAAVATPGMLPALTTTPVQTADAEMLTSYAAWSGQVQSVAQRSSATSEEGVNELDGSGMDVWTTFSRFAQPGTIRPHPNSAVRDAGGYIAEMPGNSVLGFRPFTKSGRPAIDLHGIAGFDWLRKFKFFH